jgi:hypothetical protein
MGKTTVAIELTQSERSRRRTAQGLAGAHRSACG